MSRAPLVAAVALLLLATPLSSCLGGTRKTDPQVPDGFTGIGWKPTVPMKRATLIGYDNGSLLDDYAYLASVPTAVFQSGGKLLSSPLLFYKKEMNMSGGEDDPAATLDDGMGPAYLLDDYLTYAGGKLDMLTAVNIGDAASVRTAWPAGTFRSISAKDPYGLSARIARANWEFADEAVVVPVAEKYGKSGAVVQGDLSGSVPGSFSTQQTQITGSKPVGVTPIFHNFSIQEPYKYIAADMTWHGAVKLLDPLMQRGKDPDLQLYDWALGEVAASEEWNVMSGPHEHAESYIYHPGPWAAAVTYMPTKSLGPETAAEPGGSPDGPAVGPEFLSDARYQIDITLYPGVEVNLPVPAGRDSYDAEFNLSWTGDARLGLVIRGPEGAEVGTDNDGVSPASISLHRAGEGRYTATVVKLSNGGEAQYSLTYLWKNPVAKAEPPSLTAAADGAVIASERNEPLLFIPLSGELPEETKEAARLLGVKRVILLNPGNYAPGAAERAKGLGGALDGFTVEEVSSLRDIHRMARKSDDVVFSTLHGWSAWVVDSDGPEWVEEGARHIGPAAFAAAHHGAPVYFVENHPQLSSANAWHSEYWKRAYPGRTPPSVGAMVLTGRSIVDFLRSEGVNGVSAKPVPVLTVADQFDIGTAWDRSLVGPFLPGRIMGTPVDAAMWISRSALYPALIQASPALSPLGVEKVTGTASTVDPGPEIGGGIAGVQVNATFPVTLTWVSYEHRFNERASRYWGTDYVGADGVVPYRTKSNDPIDDGVNAKYGQPGMYWPDMSVSDVVPFYTDKMGYTAVFSTNYKDTMANLNSGSVLWLEIMHGGNRGSGVVGFWDDGTAHNEKNPWRAYEQGGSTREPDTVASNKHTGGDMFHHSVSEYDRDGIVISILQQQQTASRNGYDFHRDLKNLHSMGFYGGSCLIANTLLHLALARHGSVFQVIDPWLTSWYSSFGIETFARDLALGRTAGEAYVEGIRHVGILYLTGQWWWDIFENLVYYGDPKLKVWSPVHRWDSPKALSFGAVVSGHAPFGATDHPNASGGSGAAALVAGAAVLVVAGGLYLKWKRPAAVMRVLRAVSGMRMRFAASVRRQSRGQ